MWRYAFFVRYEIYQGTKIINVGSNLFEFKIEDLPYTNPLTIVYDNCMEDLTVRIGIPLEGSVVITSLEQVSFDSTKTSNR